MEYWSGSTRKSSTFAVIIGGGGRFEAKTGGFWKGRQPRDTGERNLNKL